MKTIRIGMIRIGRYWLALVLPSLLSFFTLRSFAAESFADAGLPWSPPKTISMVWQADHQYERFSAAFGNSPRSLAAMQAGAPNITTFDNPKEKLTFLLFDVDAAEGPYLLYLAINNNPLWFFEFKQVVSNSSPYYLINRQPYL